MQLDPTLGYLYNSCGKNFSGLQDKTLLFVEANFFILSFKKIVEWSFLLDLNLDILTLQHSITE